MNLELLESFGQNFPEDFDGTLDCMSVAITCQFNRRGTLLAVGCNDGRIFIWDFLTRGIAKIINAHVHPVCSLSWNRNGYNLLSSSTDNVVCIWNVVNGECLRKYRFPCPILKIQFNPRDSSMFLISLLKYPSILVNLDGSYFELPLDDPNEPNVISSFDRRGDFIYCGNGKGKVSVFKTSNKELVTSFKVANGHSSSSTIKQIEFARRGTSFLVSTADRIIRVYDTADVLPSQHNPGLVRNGDPEPLQRLQDLVNRTLWKKCCFSGDGEYICAGSSRSYSLYIWEKNVGNLVKILHGTKGEMLLDVVWHPVRPLIASVSSGVVSIWSQNQVENWSAFAPDFKELDENVEYEERESEFDLEDEDKSIHASKDKEDEEIDVDVTTVQPIQAFLSSDEEDENGQLLFLTIAPEFDEIEDNIQKPVDNNYASNNQNINIENKNKPDLVTGVQNTSSKPQSIVIDINLPNAPVNETHPLTASGKRTTNSSLSASKTTASISINSTLTSNSSSTSSNKFSKSSSKSKLKTKSSKIKNLDQLNDENGEFY